MKRPALAVLLLVLGCQNSGLPDSDSGIGAIEAGIDAGSVDASPDAGSGCPPEITIDPSRARLGGTCAPASSPIDCSYMGGAIFARCIAPENVWAFCSDRRSCDGELTPGAICCRNYYQGCPDRAGLDAGSCTTVCDCVDDHVRCSLSCVPGDGGSPHPG